MDKKRMEKLVADLAEFYYYVESLGEEFEEEAQEVSRAENVIIHVVDLIIRTQCEGRTVFRNSLIKRPHKREDFNEQLGKMIHSGQFFEKGNKK